MGSLIECRCDGCDYTEPEMTVGQGMAARNELQLCRNCSRVVNVLVWLQPDSAFESEELRAKLGRCPRCAGDELEEIEGTELPCPRCGGSLALTRVGLWD